jgi:hypothetical protein
LSTNNNAGIARHLIAFLALSLFCGAAIYAVLSLRWCFDRRDAVRIPAAAE